jgi:hypothetical protein
MLIVISSIIIVFVCVCVWHGLSRLLKINKSGLEFDPNIELLIIDNDLNINIRRSAGSNIRKEKQKNVYLMIIFFICCCCWCCVENQSR